MATITVTEILGSDNIAGSRVTINDNFKKVVNAINTVETYLDTSFTPGAYLNVGSALIKKYTRPITDQIFTCEATGLFSGNLNIGQDLGVNRDFTTSRNLTVNGNVTMDGTAANTSLLSISIPIQTNSSTINTQFYAAATSNSLVINPQSLAQTPSATERIITTTNTFKKTSVIRLDYSTYSGSSPNNCTTLVLPSVTDANVGNGQIITLLVDSQAPASTSVSFELSLTNLDTCYTGKTIKFNGTPGDADLDAFRQSSITLFADSTGWRILHYTGLVTIS